MGLFWLWWVLTCGPVLGLILVGVAVLTGMAPAEMGNFSNGKVEGIVWMLAAAWGLFSISDVSLEMMVNLHTQRGVSMFSKMGIAAWMGSAGWLMYSVSGNMEALLWVCGGPILFLLFCIWKRRMVNASRRSLVSSDISESEERST